MQPNKRRMQSFRLHWSIIGKSEGNKWVSKINPNSHKVRQLSLEFLQHDITDQWHWNNFDKQAICTQLNKYLALRGEVVHQGRSSHDPKNPHLVKRDELDKAIRFFKCLVDATCK